MHVNELYDLKEIDESVEIESFFNEMIFEGIVESREEAQVLTESRVNKVIQDYVRRYGGSAPPEAMVFQDVRNPKHYAILAAGDGTFFRFDVVNDKVVNEERYRDFRELMDEREVLTNGTFRPVDTRTYLQKNWKRLLMWLIGGTAVALIGAPILFAWLMSIASAVSFVAKVAVGVAAVAGTGWLMQRLSGNDGATDRWNASGRM